MAHTQRRVTFLLVEGDTDLLVFRRFVHPQACDILVCHNRANALHATRLLDETGEPGFVAVIDADFDRLGSVERPSPNCVWTDFHDLEVVLVCSSALDRLLAERASETKVSQFETRNGRSVRDAILEGAMPLGYLRWLNHLRSLRLTFENLNFARLVNDETLSLDFTRTVQVVVQRSASIQQVAELRNDCDQLARAGHDPRHVCCGHDVVAILGRGLRRTLGSLRAVDVAVDTLELELRLAFDRECFEQTEIRARLAEWQARNNGWGVLESQ